MEKKFQTPLHLLRSVFHLTPKNLEKKLLEFDKVAMQNGLWTEAARTKGFFFDLSQVRFANISAAAQLTLIIESAQKSRVPIYIALPTTQLSIAESQSTGFDNNLKLKILRSREEANSFLKTIKFDEAVLCKHLANSSDVSITEQYNFTDEPVENNLQNFRDAFSEKSKLKTRSSSTFTYTYKYILPLTWISAAYGPVIDSKLEEVLENVLIEEDRGVEQIDMMSIKNVILSELVKNVREHSTASHALLSIGLMPRGTLIKDDESTKTESLQGYKIEEDYLTWLQSNEIKNFIEIYFGDSGTGLVSNELNEAYRIATSGVRNLSIRSKMDKIELLKWSFGKWSTRKTNEKIRGTKGLYRINRIVNKYNGIFFIRTSGVYGGYQKGGYSSSKWINSIQDKHVHIPGTFVSIKLCPHKEIAKLSFTFTTRPINRKWIILSQQLCDDSIGEFTNWIADQNELKDENANILLILQSKTGFSIQSHQESIGEILKSLSYVRHPNGIVVHFSDDIGKSTLEEIVQSTNEMLLRDLTEHSIPEAISSDSEAIYDPILVIGKKKSIAWFGGSQRIIAILKEIYDGQSEKKSLDDLESFRNLKPEEKYQVLSHFRNDDSLITVSSNLDIHINFSNIADIFRERLKRKMVKGSALSAPLCTPKLKVVNYWHDVKDILAEKVDVIGYALVMYLKISEYHTWASNTKSVYILIDHTVQLPLALELGNLMGIGKRNIINILDDIDILVPRRSTLFNANDEVFILTSIISTSETIRRLVKYVKRDLALPKCIIGLANLRDRSMNAINTWEEETPILSVLN